MLAHLQCACCIGACTAHAVARGNDSLYGSGDVTGISSLVVGTQTYDIEFLPVTGNNSYDEAYGATATVAYAFAPGVVTAIRSLFNAQSPVPDVAETDSSINNYSGFYIPISVNVAFSTVNVASANHYIPGSGSVMYLATNFYYDISRSSTYDPGAKFAWTRITAAAATPLPTALPLFASGLGVMGLLGWRRKRKKAAALAAA
jgi:hypothetical protein